MKHSCSQTSEDHRGVKTSLKYTTIDQKVPSTEVLPLNTNMGSYFYSGGSCCCWLFVSSPLPSFLLLVSGSLDWSPACYVAEDDLEAPYTLAFALRHMQPCAAVLKDFNTHVMLI